MSIVFYDHHILSCPVRWPFVSFAAAFLVGLGSFTSGSFRVSYITPIPMISLHLLSYAFHRNCLLSLSSLHFPSHTRPEGRRNSGFYDHFTVVVSISIIRFSSWFDFFELLVCFTLTRFFHLFWQTCGEIFVCLCRRPLVLFAAAFFIVLGSFNGHWL